jgi:hypothetical protein
MSFPKWFRGLLKSLVQDVPPSLDACEICREGRCSQGRWESCPNRLATEEAVKLRHASEEGEDPSDSPKNRSS